MKSKYKFFSTLLIGGLAVGLSQTAYAACTQADAAGSWQTYSINSEAVWVSCKINVSTTGTIANTNCFSSFGSSGLFSSGKLKLTSASACTYVGSFKLNGATNTVRSATMTKDKLIVNGVGTYAGGSFNFNMTKL
jgi:hypothetical protein